MGFSRRPGDLPSCLGWPLTGPHPRRSRAFDPIFLQEQRYELRRAPVGASDRTLRQMLIDVERLQGLGVELLLYALPCSFVSKSRLAHEGSIVPPRSCTD